MKEPLQRATYAQLLQHPWLQQDTTREVDMLGWVSRAVERRDRARKSGGISAANGANAD